MKEYKCPHCKRGIFNRRNPICEFCEKRLPTELLMSENEKAAIIIAEDEAQNAARKKRRAKRRKQSGSDGGVSTEY